MKSSKCWFVTILYLLLIAFYRPAAHAQPVEVPVSTDSSFIEYTGRYTVHTWTGISRDVEGILRVDVSQPEQTNVSITVPAESFETGRSRRDEDQYEAMETEEYPNVRFTSTSVEVNSWQSTENGHEGEWNVYGDLVMHGVTRQDTLPVQVTVTDRQLEAQSTFPVYLTNYDIRRPRLFFVAIRDRIDVEVHIQAELPPSGGE